MTILITGATGAVGRLVVAGLLAQGESVRAVTRDPATADLPGAHVVAADPSDPATLTAEVFKDVDRVFVFPTDAGVETLMDAATDAGVQDFVVLSSLAAAMEHPRDVGSASAVHHLAIERAVTHRTDRWVIVRPGTFANNLLSWSYNVRSGTPIRAPYLQSAQAPIHEADVADVLVELLRDPTAHHGEAIAITGPEAVSRADQVGLIGKAVGVDIELIEISPDEFRSETAQFIPADITKMLLDYWSDTATAPDKVRPVTAVTGRAGRTLAQWAEDHRGDFGATA